MKPPSPSLAAARASLQRIGRKQKLSGRGSRYSFSGVSAFAGGETSNATVVRQVVENEPVVATAATRSYVPSAFSATA